MSKGIGMRKGTLNIPLALLNESEFVEWFLSFISNYSTIYQETNHGMIIMNL